MSSVAQELLASDGFGKDITSRPFRGISPDGRWSWYEVRMSVRRQNNLLICEGLMLVLIFSRSLCSNCSPAFIAIN